MLGVDLTGADAAMTLAGIKARDELGVALEVVRPFVQSPNVEVRAFAGAWVAIGEALADRADIGQAIRAFDEVVRLLRLPNTERCALLEAREIIENAKDA